MRPADGQLYGVGSASRLYLLNAITGVATQIGPVFPTVLSGTTLRRGLQPVVDRMRVVSDAEQNLRINPNNAAIAGVDTPLNPAGTVGGGRLRQQRRGRGHDGPATTSTPRPISGASGHPGPNDGALIAIGPLGVNTSFDIAFDISPLDNTAFAALNVGGVSGLYTINLVTGGATLDRHDRHRHGINGLTAMPLAYQFAEGATGTFFDTDLLLANPPPRRCRSRSPT